MRASSTNFLSDAKLDLYQVILDMLFLRFKAIQLLMHF